MIWHTQGSGKSLLMAFFAGLAVKSERLENPTLVVLTDRNDLDDQLYGTFGLCRDLIRQTPVQADSREDLQKALIFVGLEAVFGDELRRDFRNLALQLKALWKRA